MLTKCGHGDMLVLNCCGYQIDESSIASKTHRPSILMTQLITDNSGCPEAPSKMEFTTHTSLASGLTCRLQHVKH